MNKDELLDLLISKRVDISFVNVCPTAGWYNCKTTKYKLSEDEFKTIKNALKNNDSSD